MNLATLSVVGSRARLLGLMAIVACRLASPCHAADIKIYLEIKEISGDVTDRGYENQVAVLSYSVVPGPSGGGSISLVKPIDSSSPALTLFAAAGTIIKRAIVREVQSTNGTVDSKTTIDMRDVIVSGVQTGGSTGDGIPTETVSFNFGKVTYKYWSQDKKGGT